jgi:hypothetical protein
LGPAYSTRRNCGGGGVEPNPHKHPPPWVRQWQRGYENPITDGLKYVIKHNNGNISYLEICDVLGFCAA